MAGWDVPASLSFLRNGILRFPPSPPSPRRIRHPRTRVSGLSYTAFAALPGCPRGDSDETGRCVGLGFGWADGDPWTGLAGWQLSLNANVSVTSILAGFGV
ncbi:hypothetical protein SUNI508_01506 [Seiridium unicorne]|uniref:Uncharacterized protein n=1 Tax=Seiridium unicorne TaxID=138068 RepID=A0ABR2UTT6_9PEZI